MLNALLFVLMGLEVQVLNISGCTVLVAGLALPLGLLGVGGAFRSSVHSITVLTWSGLRSGLAGAGALSLPASMPRELLVGITYMVAFSIIG